VDVGLNGCEPGLKEAGRDGVEEFCCLTGAGRNGVEEFCSKELLLRHLSMIGFAAFHFQKMRKTSGDFFEKKISAKTCSNISRISGRIPRTLLANLVNFETLGAQPLSAHRLLRDNARQNGHQNRTHHEFVRNSAHVLCWFASTRLNQMSNKCRNGLYENTKIIENQIFLSLSSLCCGDGWLGGRHTSECQRSRYNK
jgi:hypothetical protein